MALPVPVRVAPETKGDRVLGAAMALLLAVGFCLAIAALMAPESRRRLDGTLNAASMLGGRTSAAINYATAHYLPIDGALRAAGGVIRWRLFGSGGPQVWVGRHDWLFLMEELRPFANAQTAMRARVAALGHVRDQLSARGIDLLVALVPDKARVMREEVDGPRSAEAEDRYPELLRLLAQARVPVVDLLGAFGVERAKPSQIAGPLFYRTDTHWNQRGAAVAARAIALSITTLLDRNRKFRTEAEPSETALAGDLLRLMSLERIPDDLSVTLRPPADRQHVERTVEVAPAAAAGLLDDGPAVEVALVGSSYSVNANFAGRLSEAIGAQVGNFATAGGAFAGAARPYFEGTTFRESPPRLLIWEIPERVMGQPMGLNDKALEAWAAAIGGKADGM